MVFALGGFLVCADTPRFARGAQTLRSGAERNTASDTRADEQVYARAIKGTTLSRVPITDQHVLKADKLKENLCQFILFAHFAGGVWVHVSTKEKSQSMQLK